MDIDLEHPPERIWRALTEAKLLSQWLNLPDFTPVSEAEVTGIDGERRLAMLWGNGELDTRLVWELAPTPDGARVTVRQACVYGEWTDEFRERLRDAYDPVLHERLPAILDWLAFQEVDLSAAAPAPAPDSSPTVAGEPESFASPKPPAKRRPVRLIALAMGALVVGGVLVILAIRPGGEDPVAAPPATTPPPSPSPSGPTGIAAIGAGVVEVTPSATARPSTSPTLTTRPPVTSRAEATPAPAVPVLSARYATLSTGLFGYRGEVTVNNTGRAAAPSWTVTITVDPGARVTSNAQFSQDGGTVTFTGGTVGASGSARFEFEVNDLGEDGPNGCQIDGKACTSE
jgi:uncharacterized protein YndB with AHSA1/START domain